MKYVKTFEKFNYETTNEGFFALSSIDDPILGDGGGYGGGGIGRSGFTG